MKQKKNIKLNQKNNVIKQKSILEDLKQKPKKYSERHR